MSYRTTYGTFPKKSLKIWLRRVCLKQLVIFLCRLRSFFSFVFFFLFFGMVSLQLLISFSPSGMSAFLFHMVVTFQIIAILSFSITHQKISSHLSA